MSRDLPPVLSLDAFRARHVARLATQNDGGCDIDATIDDGHLELTFTRTGTFLLEAQDAEWLRDWCNLYLSQQRRGVPEAEGRWRPCGRLKDERRGPRSLRWHHTLGVLPVVWPAEPPASHCGRRRRLTNDWAQVTCEACLKSRPKVVP